MALPCKLYDLQDETFESLEEDFDKDPWDIVEEAERLFINSGIRISSYEELYEACIDATGKVLGSSVAGSPGQGLEEGDPRINIRFSVAVAPEARRRGIAKALIESIMASYPSDDFLLEAWVVNPHMVALLQRLGFEEDGEWTPDNPFMRRPNPGENSPKLRIKITQPYLSYLTATAYLGRRKAGQVTAAEYPKSWEIEGMKVHQDFRRQGIATKLYLALADYVCGGATGAPKPLLSQGWGRSPDATQVWEQIPGATPIGDVEGRDSRGLLRRWNANYTIPCDQTTPQSYSASKFGPQGRGLPPHKWRRNPKKLRLKLKQEEEEETRSPLSDESFSDFRLKTTSFLEKGLSKETFDIAQLWGTYRGVRYKIISKGLGLQLGSTVRLEPEGYIDIGNESRSAFISRISEQTRKQMEGIPSKMVERVIKDIRNRSTVLSVSIQDVSDISTVRANLPALELAAAHELKFLKREHAEITKLLLDDEAEYERYQKLALAGHVEGALSQGREGEFDEGGLLDEEERNECEGQRWDLYWAIGELKMKWKDSETFSETFENVIAALEEKERAGKAKKYEEAIREIKQLVSSEICPGDNRCRKLGWPQGPNCIPITVRGVQDRPL